jgi:phage tail-like protein
MDVNGTRFHLVLTASEWLPPEHSNAVATNLEWSEGGLRLRRLLPVFPPRKAEQPPTVEQRRGAGRDCFGNWYWISDDAHEVRARSRGARASDSFWSVPDAQRCDGMRAAPGEFRAVSLPTDVPLELSGLAVTTDHYLVVGSLLLNGLLVFDLHGGGAPVEVRWPGTVPFAPFDIASAADGGVWVLDRDARLLWRLDRFFRVVPAHAPVTWVAAGFAPLGGWGPELPTLLDEPFSASAAWSLSETADPIAVAALPDDSVLVLDRAPAGVCSKLLRYASGEDVSSVAFDTSLTSGTEMTDSTSHALPLHGHDLAFVAASADEGATMGIVYVVAGDGNQAFAFDLSVDEPGFTLVLRRDYLPMRLFGGKALVAGGTAAFYDSADSWSQLAQQPNTRSAALGTARLPASSTPDDVAFDGKEPRCVWHRLLADGCIPPDASVEVRARAADSVAALRDMPWQRQPSPYLRPSGSELPYQRVGATGNESEGTWELLFQNISGQFLQLEISLRGTGRSSPRLECLRVYYPRFSYLMEYLPAVYREDAESASFLDRFLANVEGTYTAIEGRIEQVQSLFDVRTAPAGYLDWLAAWLGASLDADWSESTRRRFLASARRLFRERGTRAGMVRSIRLALASSPSADLFSDVPCASADVAGFGVRVVEEFRTRRAPGVVFGDPTDLLGPGSTTDASGWTPAQGAQPLHQKWRDFLAGRYSDITSLNDRWGSAHTAFSDSSLMLPSRVPTNMVAANDWRDFTRGVLGFTYADVTDADEPLYREFLARRYRQAADLNAAYALAGTGALTTFSDAPAKLWRGLLHDAIPASGNALRDWITFVSVVLPMARNAHRFTVLVPVSLDDSPETQLQRRRLAERVVELEKPAHTYFDVRLYWGMFRAGEARVGLDTLLGPGARASALALDRGALGDSFLGYVPPWTARDRLVVGDESSPTPDQRACCT